jgi:hypothetical protein
MGWMDASVHSRSSLRHGHRAFLTRGLSSSVKRMASAN